MIVSKHPPIGPDLLALDLYDQDVVKIKAELPVRRPASTSLRVAQRGDLCLFLPEQCGQIVSDEIADLGKLDIRGRALG